MMEREYKRDMQWCKNCKQLHNSSCFDGPCGCKPIQQILEIEQEVFE